MSRAVLASTLCLIALAACGDDEEGAGTQPPRTATSPGPAATATGRTATVQATLTEPGPTETAQAPGTSPEDQPGGAGDEEPARSQALFTGRGGQVRPRIVLVAPFIAVRVELRSGDGRAYSLAGRGRRLKVGSGQRSASTTFEGQRPGRRIVLRGSGGRVVVEASAEPGP